MTPSFSNLSTQGFQQQQPVTFGGWRLRGKKDKDGAAPELPPNYQFVKEYDADGQKAHLYENTSYTNQPELDANGCTVQVQVVESSGQSAFAPTNLPYSETVSILFPLRTKEDGTGFFPGQFKKTAFKALKLFSKLQMRKAGLKLEIPDEAVRLANSIPKGDGLIMVINHHSGMDPMLLSQFIDKHNREGRFIANVHNFVQKPGLGNLVHNLTGYLCQNSGAFSYDKSKDANGDKTNQFALNVLTEGEHTLAYFPEGVETHSLDTIIPVYKGVGDLALAAMKMGPKKEDGSPHRVWIMPVIFAPRFDENVLPVIQKELTVLKNLNQQCDGDPRKLTEADVEAAGKKVEKAKNKELSHTEVQDLGRELMDSYVNVYLVNHPDALKTELPNVLIASGKTRYKLLQVTEHILQQVGPKYGIRKSAKIDHHFFALNQLISKIETAAYQNPDSQEIKQDFADARLALCLYNLSHDVEKHGKEQTQESLYHAMMYLRYYLLEWIAPGTVDIPKTVKVAVGEPMDISYIPYSKKLLAMVSPKAPIDQSDTKLHSLALTALVQHKMQKTLDEARKDASTQESK